ncbi:MAG: hypothetical protein KF732_02025 [Flavobacteriales bacterium]|nr:hypothetical protein [Flavobacteriales bacterium]
MKYLALNFSVLVLAIFISNKSFAQLNENSKDTKTSAATEIKQEVKVVQQSSNEPQKSPHGHLLMKEIPIHKNVVSKTDVNEGVAKGGIRGNEVIGEGEYLNYNKVIMQKSITGKIPVGFPKHIKGQTPEQYKAVIMDWARNNKNLIKEEYHHEIK